MTDVNKEVLELPMKSETVRSLRKKRRKRILEILKASYNRDQRRSGLADHQTQ